MGQFVKGMALCEGFFRECAQGILETHFPGMRYSAGLIGYGSDVLGYDDPVSTDHMWGPRFYLFLGEGDLKRKMRLCFLYREEYAPYSKWFGTAFQELDIPDGIKRAVGGALAADTLEGRERLLVEAQALVAELHNSSGLTGAVDFRIEDYFGRNIKVIFADKFAEAVRGELAGTAFEDVPLIGSLSQVGGLGVIADDQAYRERVMRLYERGLLS